ncbi:MAG TPA: FAD binding domain-containing protein, partial [Gemmatimonadaceae bacterium]|nr:FAD binding domain-containing protein [Gemmatimonadaceae bacterium]
PPAALVGDAMLRIASADGTREIATSEFFVDSRRTVLRPGELLEAVLLQRPAPRSGTAFERFGLRRGLALAVASVAARIQLDGDRITGAAAALGAVAATPMPVPAVAELLYGKRPSARLFLTVAATCADAARPISDVRGSAEFRREIVATLALRALERATARARADGSLP